jgi:serine/threonine protein kinase
MQTLEGTQLGNYDVVRRIRVGGMGAVYVGRQRTAFGRQVAIKVILGNYANDRDMRRRFAREARTIAQLRHPHILPLIEFGDERGLLYLVMPFIEGGTLTSFLRRELPDLQDIAAIFLQLLDAVEYAHEQGLIHRDIKSSNVLLDARRNGKPYAYLADFGLVRTTQNLELEESGQPIPLDQIPGTPHYMAPEQARGIVTPLTDIYALGVLLFQMLTGELPYDDPDDVEVAKMHLYAPVPSPCDLDTSIPAELGEVTQRAMAKRPEQRFATIAEFRQAFLAAIEERTPRITEDDPQIDMIVEPVLEPQEPLEPPVQPKPQRKRPTAVPLPRIPRQRPREQMRHQAREQPREQLREHQPQERIRLAPRYPSGPLSQAELQQETAVFVPGATSRSRHGGAPAAQPPRSWPKRATQGGRRRYVLAAAIALLVPLLLIALLTLPRAFGVYLFPSSVPLIGAPVATVSITVKSQTVTDNYLLMASPKVVQPDITSRTLPDRILSVTLTGNRVVNTSGTKTIPGAQATGTLQFENKSHQSVSVPQGMQFTASNGVVVMLEQAVEIPPRSDGQNGIITAPAIAVEQGANGNIAANMLFTTCCNGQQVIVSNPQPFSGGADAHQVHTVAQADLDNVLKALSPGLQQQALQKLQGQLTSGEVEAGHPSITTKVSSNSPAGAQANTVNVQVRLTAQVVAYNASTARQMAGELLIRQAEQRLGNNYQLKNALAIAAPVFTSPGLAGAVYLSVSASGLWLYHLTQQEVDQWRQSIKGATPQLAETYINSQPGVANVRIQLPFGTDHLPSSINQIQIVLVNV